MNIIRTILAVGVIMVTAPPPPKPPNPPPAPPLGTPGGG